MHTNTNMQPIFTMIWQCTRYLSITPKDLVAIGGLSCLFTVLEGVGLSAVFLILKFMEHGREALMEQSPRSIVLVLNLIGQIGLPLSLPMLLGAVVFTLIFRQVVGYAKTTYGLHLQMASTKQLQKLAAKKYLLADMPYYLYHNRTDVMYVTRMLSARVVQLVTIVNTTLQALLLLLGYMAFLVVMSPMTFTLLVPALLVITFTYRKAATKGRVLGRKQHLAVRAWVERMLEAINGIRLIKMRRMEESINHRIERLIDEDVNSKLRLQRINALTEATIIPLIFVLAIASIYSAYSLMGMSIATLGLFALIIIRIAPQLSILGKNWANIGNTLQAWEEYQKGLATIESYREPPSGTEVFTSLKQGIALQQVEFKYDFDKDSIEALTSLDLFIPAKKTIALVGPSGAGKSTIVDLLPGFIRPSKGSITYDGIKLEEYEIGQLRRRIAMVSQDPVMFDDTIRSNIQFGIDDGSEERLETALNRAHCDFINQIPGGVEARVGEQGVRLSGGQRQRIALARALYTQPEILILDEPTSALDSQSENAIQRALSELHDSMTIIVIAHRLSTVRRADMIYVIDCGKVVASGTHQELVDQVGLYSTLFKLQS